MTSFHVICGLPPPPNQKSWLRLDLQMPDFGSNELLRANDEYLFLFAKHYKNLAHPCPEQILRLTEKSYLYHLLKQNENSNAQHVCTASIYDTSNHTI